MALLSDPFQSTDPNVSTTLQQFSGAGNVGGPMPVSTSAPSSSANNPFADVLNHVSAWNDALNSPATPKDGSNGTGLLGSVPNTAATSNPQAGNEGGGTATGGIVPPTPPASDPNADTPSTRIRPSITPPVYSDANPPPHPGPNATDQEILNYYRSFNYKNPAFGNMTLSDLHAYWDNPQGMTIGDWYLAGNRGPAENPLAGTGMDQPPVQQPPPDPTPDPTPTPVPDQQPQPVPVQPAPQPAPAPPPVQSPPSTPTPPPTPTPDPNPPAPPPPTTNSPDPTAPPDIQSLIDTFQKDANTGNGPDIESMLDPMFARQRQKLDDQLRASAALTPGRLESGGFGMNEGQALTDLSGQQSGQLANALQQQHLAQMTQNTQLIQLGTTAGMQKYVADLNADLTKFQVNSNADLQKWLDNSDNALKKYGIDTNDLMARYQAELQLKGQMYTADRGVDAAALQAAAAHAAADAQAQASTQNAQLQYQLGLQGLGVDREKNIGSFILGLMGLGNTDLNTLNGILNGILPGTTVVKP